MVLFAGKAGGFLAKDWCRGPVDALARCSFELHAELAHRFGADSIGYRPVTTTSVSTSRRVAAQPTAQRTSHEGVPAWVGSGSSVAVPSGSGPLGTPPTTAQVHPLHLTKALASHAQSKGCTIVRAQVVDIKAAPKEAQRRSSSDRPCMSTPQYTIYTQEPVTTASAAATATAVSSHGPFDVVVLAMGAWTDRANAWLPGVMPDGCTNVKVHSVILQGTAAADGSSTNSVHAPTMLFVHDGVQGLEPEVYPRPCGEVYTCDISSDTPVPDTPAQVLPDEGACDKLEVFLRGLGGGLECSSAFPLKAAQACYLPYSPDDVPIVGPSEAYPGVFLGTGHSCWGILLGPATGLILAHQALGLAVPRLTPGTLRSLSTRHSASSLNKNCE